MFRWDAVVPQKIRVRLFANASGVNSQHAHFEPFQKSATDWHRCRRPRVSGRMRADGRATGVEPGSMGAAERRSHLDSVARVGERLPDAERPAACAEHRPAGVRAAVDAAARASGRRALRPAGPARPGDARKSRHALRMGIGASGGREFRRRARAVLSVGERQLGQWLFANALSVAWRRGRPIQVLAGRTVGRR